MIKNNIIRLLDNKISLFVFAFLLMASYLFPAKDLITGSMDASETWKVVTTFFSHDPYSSYVMYKGFLAFIPNIALYELAIFFDVDLFFFVKIFNCISFAYITTIGIPYFFAYIFGNKIKYYKIYILTLILYFGIRPNFSFISVDFPSIVLMMLTMNSAIKIKISEKKLPIFYYIYAGIIFSMGLLLSGQYIPAVIFTLAFLFFSEVIPVIRQKKINFRSFVILACFILGFFVINVSNNYFIETRVQPVREAGEWLPTANDWFKFALTNNMLFSKLSSVMIPDNRGKAILISENADMQAISGGGGAYNYDDYAMLVLKYPIDFIVRWANRLFLGISIDSDKLKFIYLFISYTLLFLSLLTIKKKCEKLKDFLDLRIFLILAMATPSLIPCFIHVEMRYFMSIQILIAGIALLSDTLWKSLLNFKDFVSLIIVSRGKIISKMRINYLFISYIIFVTLCFMLLATQYELLGPIPNILFKF